MQRLRQTRGDTKIIVLCIVLFIVIGHFVFDLFGIDKDNVTRRPADWAQKQMRFINMEATDAEVSAHIEERMTQLTKVDELINKYHAKKGHYPKGAGKLQNVIHRAWPHYLEFRNYNSNADGYYLTSYDQLTLEEITIPAALSAAGSGVSVDQSVLIKLVRDPAATNKAKAKAIAQVTDQSVLFDLATTSLNFTIKRAAIQQLRDVSYIKQIYDTETNPVLRSEVLGNLDDERFLEQVAKDQKESKNVRQTAIAGINNEYILASIIRSIKNVELSALAVEKISDEQLLRRFWSKEYPKKVRDAAIRKMALNARSELARIQAIEQCTEQQVLLQVVQESDSTRLKAAAAEKISWKPYLEEIQATETDAFVLGIVNRKLSQY